MIVYIAGKITGDPAYQIKFNHAKNQLEFQGHKVINPAMLPEGLWPESYMPINLAMIEAADAVCFIGDWWDSRGARLERAYAEYQRKEIMEGVED